MTDSVHDMGGMDGFGRVEPEADEPVFHQKWEGRVMAINRAMGAGGAWNIDMSRASRESLPPETYLTSSYYRKWQLAMENLAVERGFVDRDELAAGRSLRPGKPLKRGLLKLADIARIMTRGSFFRATNSAPKFTIGDCVRAKNIHPRTHTRLPRYVRGHVGVIERQHGCHVFPDSAALDQGDNPQWLYTVVFESRELWGDDADPTLKVSIDAFEPYLEPA
jgi:nitrile hydratase subunit beta